MNSQFQIWNAGGLPSELLFLFNSAYGQYEIFVGVGQHMQYWYITPQFFWMVVIHYLKNKVGVVDFANAQGVVMF